MNTPYALTDAGQPGGATPIAAPRRGVSRLARRARAVVRLALRRRRASRRCEELRHLEDVTLRDLGLTRSEAASFAYELGGFAAATRRRTDLDAWLSASSRLRIRSTDSFL